MKDWFKARNIWGAAIMTLSDAEAGRFAKALWGYTMTGEAPEVSGNEKGIFAIALMTLGLDDQEGQTLSEKRAAAGSKGGKQRAENEFASEANQANQANACNKNKSKNKEQEEDIKEIPSNEGTKKSSRFSPPTMEEVTAYCRERGNAVNAQRFVDFYAAKGWKVGNQPMKDWKAAVRTWEQRDSQQATQAPARKPPAAQYKQREYTEEQLSAAANNPLLKYLQEMDA